MNTGRETPESAASARRRRGHGSRSPWLFALIAAGLGAAAVLVAVYAGLVDPPRGSAPELLRPPAGEAPEATLYFADPRWTRLLPERRRLPLPSEGGARIRALVAALAEGPREAGAPILPQGVTLRGAYLGPGGLAAVDLEPEAIPDGAGGASGELLLVYALVQTVVANVPGVQGVQILVNGQERETLAGHVKISEVLRPNPELVGTKE